MKPTTYETIRIGKKFGFLKVENSIGKRNGSWICKCDCGNKRRFYTSDLIKGHNYSCGCKAGLGNFKHGFASNNRKDRFYRIWDGIQKRIYLETDKYYYRYGGRGIKCKWSNFIEFKDDMHKNYLIHVKKFGEDNTQIDRINNDGNYSKGNCKWATRSEQANNRKDNVFLFYKNKKITVGEYVKIANVSKHTIFNRIKRGWNNDRIISEKIHSEFRNKKITTQ